MKLHDEVDANISSRGSYPYTPLLIELAEGIKLAEADGVDWVFHVDTDELMYPASAAEYSLQAWPLVASCMLDHPAKRLSSACFDGHVSMSMSSGREVCVSSTPDG